MVSGLILCFSGYPNGYDSQLQCNWIISSGISSMHPMITFRDIDLEESENCTADHIDVYSNREDGSWRNLDKLCSYDMRIPKTFEGTPDLKVSMTTDYGVNKTGFNAYILLRCGGVMTEPNGVIEIDPAKLYYQSFLTRMSSNCVWNITVRRGRQIQFEFETLNFTRHNNECDSYVSIKNGVDDSSPILGNSRYCGNQNVLPIIPTTTGNRAFVKFVQRQLLFLGQFKLFYKEVSHECGEEIRLTSESKSRIVTSPNYPESPNRTHIECFWVIVAPIGESVRVDFLDRFDLTYSSNCHLEYVELRDGSTQNAQLLGTLCKEKPMTINTKSNTLRIKYFTDVTDPKNGFKGKSSFSL